MHILYKFSPLLIFIWAYFLWNKLDRFSIASAANGLIMLVFILLIALVPTVPIYFARKKKSKTHSRDLLDVSNDAPPVQFYTILSTYSFYIGFILMAVSTYYVKFN